MARPRFHRLPEPQQQAILAAALDEFSARGFRNASLNRIIAAAGLSKGSMYYYFEGKEDLYADVLRRQLEHLVESTSTSPPTPPPDADAFWEGLGDLYLRLLRRLADSPATAALLRDWLSSPGGPSLQDAQRQAAEAAMPWLAGTIATGQRVGAVRTDLDPELLAALAMGLGQAMDTWLITHPPADLEPSVRTLMDVMRRALGPASAGASRPPAG